MALHQKLKACFVIPYPLDSAPGQRFRFEQYLPFLQNNGFEITTHPFLSAETNRILYKKGFIGKKITGVFAGCFRRITMLMSIHSATIVFIAREAAPLGPPFFEWVILLLFRKKVIYDFDDSIWLTDRKNENVFFRFLKWRSKVGFICKRCHLISCGNEYLASYARKFNPNVRIIPTTIDTEIYLPIYQAQAGPVIIGWSGSVTTIEHFEFALPALVTLKKKYSDRIAFKVIGDGSYVHEELGIVGIPWVRESELRDLSEITIGIMPLPDDPWTRGKCGLKGLQYMALGIPTVMASVGVNKEIIQNGVNGFIASTMDQWVDRLSCLIENPELRTQMGKRGRTTVEQNYSVKSQMANYLSMFTS